MKMVYKVSTAVMVLMLAVFPALAVPDVDSVAQGKRGIIKPIQRPEPLQPAKEPKLDIGKVPFHGTWISRLEKAVARVNAIASAEHLAEFERRIRRMVERVEDSDKVSQQDKDAFREEAKRVTGLFRSAHEEAVDAKISFQEKIYTNALRLVKEAVHNLKAARAGARELAEWGRDLVQ